MQNSNDSIARQSVPEPTNVDLLTVSVQEFGPIAQATVNLRPLTIFVGRSNTGKTYLSKLIYAIHKTFSGFPQVPLTAWHLVPVGTIKSINSILKLFREQRQNESGQQEIRNVVYQYFKNSQRSVKDQMLEEMERCFNTDNILSTRRTRSKSGSFKIEVSRRGTLKEIWNILITSKKNSVSVDAKFNANSIEFADSSYEDFISSIRQHDPAISPKSKEEFLDSIYGGLGKFIRKLKYPDSGFRQDSYFLPANRGGILEIHKFVADIWLSQIPNLGSKNLPALQPLPKTTVDFIRTMLMVENRSGSFLRQKKGNNATSLEDIAKFIEDELIDGKLQANLSSGSAYPVFEYVPTHAKRPLKLDAASAMVSELAPIILIARSCLYPFDLLIIEEPEAHLHPGALPLIANCLARLVRNNVRVLITTHSDWLLKSLRNLILEGDLIESGHSEQNVSNDSYLLRSEVGTWEFSETSDLSGTTVDEIRFNEFDGIEPSEIERISDSLYNESVAIRNLINIPTLGSRING